MALHKVFVSYHHALDQGYRNRLADLNRRHHLFHDVSVDTGDIDEGLNDQTIREIIRDQYLRDSTVTVVLVGAETRQRKHVDWEIYSSMYDGRVNKKSGLLVINLPGSQSAYFTAAHGEDEKRVVYPSVTAWTSVGTREEYERRYPRMPDRIVDNLLEPEAWVSVAPWERFTEDLNRLRFLIDLTFRNRERCSYDLSRPMRRANS